MSILAAIRELLGDDELTISFEPHTHHNPEETKIVFAKLLEAAMAGKDEIKASSASELANEWGVTPDGLIDSLSYIRTNAPTNFSDGSELHGLFSFVNLPGWLGIRIASVLTRGEEKLRVMYVRESYAHLFGGADDK